MIERSVRLLLEDFQPEEMLESLGEVESELERLKKRGVSLPDDVAETYRQERLAEVAEGHLQTMRTPEFLLLMEGSFNVQREDGRLTLTYHHPVSSHLPMLEVAFQVTCEPNYIRQAAGFLPGQVKVTVLGQAIGVEESPTEFLLHILPVAIY